MASPDVQQEYAKLVMEVQGCDGPVVEQDAKDRRDHPRFQIYTGDMWINEISEFALLDLSASGMAISATYPLAPGEHIDVGLGKAVTAQAEVLGCRLVESPTQYTPAEFRINCRFSDTDLGMALLVRAKRSEAQGPAARIQRG